MSPHGSLTDEGKRSMLEISETTEMRTITNTGMPLSYKGYPKTGSCENNALRLSPNHGTLRLLNDDNGDDDDVYTE